jgi:cytochrome P450
MFVDRVEAFIERVLEKAATSRSTTTVDVFSLCGLLSLECICRLSFNKEFAKDDQLSHELLDALEGSVLAMGILNPIFPFLRTASFRTKLPGPIGHSYRCFQTWEKITRTLLEDLRQQSLDKLEKSRRFIAAPLLFDVNKQLGRRYTFTEATEEAMGLAVAGSGVTEHTIIYFLYALARPEGRRIQETLRQELTGSGAQSFAEVSNLPYLTACMKETFRVFPVIISTLPRILNSPMSLKDQNIILPPGTKVGMQNYVHHRDPELFPQPEDFVPERWLEHGKSELTTDLKDMNSALTTFSVGTRSCVGQTLAKVELYLALSQIVRRLDFSLHDSMTEDDMTMLDFWAVFPKGAKLVLDVKALETY